MKKTLLVLGLTGLVLGGLAVAPKTALAYKGDPNVTGPNYTAERHEGMTKAFANKDYNLWKSLVQGKGRVIQVVNEGNFAKFVQAHDFALQGNTEEAKKIRAELGLGLQNGSGKGQGGGFGRTAR